MSKTKQDMKHHTASTTTKVEPASGQLVTAAEADKALPAVQQTFNRAGPPALPADVGNLEEFAGEGFENTSKDSYAIPFISILQPLSPQLDPTGQDYIEGAKAGMIFHNINKTVHETADVIPVHYSQSFIEWVPRAKGGGFRGEQTTDDARALFEKLRDPATGKAKLPNENDLVDTRNHYCLLLRDDGGLEPVLVSMSSTQIKKSRQWMTIMRNIVAQGARGLYNPPMYSSIYRLSSQPESNDKGKWHGWKIERLGYVESTGQIGTAQTFRNQATSGMLKVDRTLATEEAMGGGGGAQSETI